MREWSFSRQDSELNAEQIIKESRAMFAKTKRLKRRDTTLPQKNAKKKDYSSIKVTRKEANTSKRLHLKKRLTTP